MVMKAYSSFLKLQDWSLTIRYLIWLVFSHCKHVAFVFTTMFQLIHSLVFIRWTICNEKGRRVSFVCHHYLFLLIVPSIKGTLVIPVNYQMDCKWSGVNTPGRKKKETEAHLNKNKFQIKNQILFNESVAVILVGWLVFYGISTIVRHLMPNPVYTYILNINMICKYILSITCLNVPELSFLHRVKWFQILTRTQKSYLLFIICLHTVK